MVITMERQADCTSLEPVSCFLRILPDMRTIIHVHETDDLVHGNVAEKEVAYL